MDGQVGTKTRGSNGKEGEKRAMREQKLRGILVAIWKSNIVEAI